MTMPNSSYQLLPGVQNATFVPDQLIAGNFKLVTGSVVIAKGQQLMRGAVIGHLKETNEWVLSNAKASDGSEIPSAILNDNADASDGPISAGVYLAGEFNARYLGIDESWSLDAITQELRKSSIFVKTSISNDLT